jgi:hypothetical protein
VNSLHRFDILQVSNTTRMGRTHHWHALQNQLKVGNLHGFPRLATALVEANLADNQWNNYCQDRPRVLRYFHLPLLLRNVNLPVLVAIGKSS